MPDKRVIVTGATGLIGKALCKELIAKGYQVVVFSRDAERARTAVPGAAEYHAWEPAAWGPWAAAVDGAHAVINLAGAPVFGKRWTAGYKQELITSRVLGTTGLVNAMQQATVKPQVFLSGSAVGWYGFRDDTKLDEHAMPGTDFLAQLCMRWEQAATRAQTLGVRTVLLRTGIVLDPSEGALPQMMLPFKLFAGGSILPGSQWFPWIHLADEVGLIMLALESEQLRGPLNLTAPTPETSRAFSKTLGRVMGRPSWAPVPGLALRVALGPVAGMLTEGQRVVPTKATAAGYQFKYPSAEGALRALLGR